MRILLGCLLALSMAVISSKRVPLTSLLSLGKRKIKSHRATSVMKTFYSGYFPLDRKLPDAQYTQRRYFLDMPIYSVIIIQTLFFFMSSWLVIIRRVEDPHTLPALSVRHWPQFCLLKASRSWSSLSPPHNHLWTSCNTQKIRNPEWFYIHIFSMEVPVE